MSVYGLVYVSELGCNSQNQNTIACKYVDLLEYS